MAATVMVIDDSATVRQSVAFVLKKAGHEVIEAEDGQDAVDKLSGQKINLIICDVNMPRMDGIEFLKTVKTLPDYKFTPVMMLTTESQAEKKAEGQAAGARAWLVKPFEPDTLMAAVSKLMMA